MNLGLHLCKTTMVLIIQLILLKCPTHPPPTNTRAHTLKIWIKSTEDILFRSQMIGEDGLKPNHNYNTNPNSKKRRTKQYTQNPPFRVRQPYQLCQMTVRCKLHNFLAFYSTTRDWQKVSSQSYAAVLPVGTIDYGHGHGHYNFFYECSYMEFFP